MDTSGNSEEHLQKKGRHRKKQLYNTLLQQMEFYFSDSNLAKDRFMSQLLQEDKHIDLNIFLTFNKIRKLTTSLDDLIKCINKSDMLELSDDKNRVCRKTPIVEKDNVDDCTVYVENIKSDTTHEWLKSIFLEFGNITYVSIPRYKTNNLNKGFAFVEFENEDSAVKTVQFFDEIGCKMSSQMVPDQLISIITFEPIEDASINEDGVIKPIKEDDVNDNKRKRDEVEEQSNAKDNGDTVNDNNADNVKSTESENSKKKQKLDTSSGNDEATESEKDSDVNNDVEDKKKKKRLLKRMAYFKELGLQILSKKEWKKMRNKYLNMQREKMKALKAHLNRKKFAMSNDKVKEDHDMDKSEEKSNNKKGIEYQPGVIVRLTLKEQIFDLKKLKTDIKNNVNAVQYVDVSEGATDVFIRFSDNEGAKVYLNNDTDGNKCLLEDEEEQNYWDKIKKDMELKCNKDKRKQRGRAKLLKRAERELGKHIRFDDTEL